ncbi:MULTISPECIES: OB-fold nucleic acid binding domain-containing protein [unclassified Arthrobacter]|uniref:OB-fold nucleic acid binding domain-containing protein n=1 Tax=unclassified Arthrobacter TaxID=235627 RepID=UPI0008A294C8|nr:MULTISPECIES: OB-fold nucleic acid binding domain-containing protein [unclassified Arthrobacter]OFT24099.1 hypothetical protein HMPREF3175_02200 [Arthrobacter sp. HMSC08H08]OFT43208.1 hypothetical protein HMPREF3160_03480 [Arthrobacter sp. HMSC06H05]
MPTSQRRTPHPWPERVTGEQIQLTGWITATTRPAPGHAASFEAVVVPEQPRPGQRLPVASAGEFVVLIWLGQQHVAGIHPGATLRFSGPVSRREGRNVIFNPRYEVLEAAPDRTDKET